MQALNIKFPSIKKVVNDLSLIRISTVIFILSFIFLTFFITPKYKSTSIIDVTSDNDDSLVSASILPSIVGTGGSSESFQLKLFLESEEASKFLEQNINVTEVFSNKNISYFSKYKDNNNDSFHDYISSMIEIVIDADSKAVSIHSYAFDKDNALMLNLELINMVVNYFNRSARLTSFNSKTNKVCDLYFINSDVLNNDDIFFEDDLSLPEGILSANDLLLRKALDFKEFCSKYLNEESLDNEGQVKLTESTLFPLFELKKLNVDASKKVISQIYEDSIGAFTSSNNIKIIAEPIIAEEYENRNILLLSFLSFICSYIIILGLKILVRLTDELYI